MNNILCFNPIKILKNNNKKYLFNINNAGLFEIDDNVEKLVLLNGKDYDEAYSKFGEIWDKDHFRNLINQLKNNKILKNNSSDIICEYNQKNDISSLVMFVTQMCNLSCKYCFGNEGEYNGAGTMSWDIAKQSVDFLVNISTSKTISIAFFGGEPLINFSLIEKVVDYSKKIAYKKDKMVEFGITTNATLLNREITEFFIKNKFSVTISIDGDKLTNDENRIFKNGKGTYDDIIENTEILRNKMPPLARGSIAGNQINLLENYIHLSELGFKSIYLSLCINLLKDNDYDTLIESNSKLIDYFEEIVKNKNYNEAKKMNNVMKILYMIHKGGEKKNFCGASLNALATDINGELYICHRFVGMERYKIGNIFMGIDSKKNISISNELNVDEHGECKNCWVKNLCGGGCPNDNFLMTGNLKKPYDNFCKLQKKLFEKVIYIYMNLNEEEKLMLFENNKKNYK
jgi:uncharacterized protein